MSPCRLPFSPCVSVSLVSPPVFNPVFFISLFSVALFFLSLHVCLSVFAAVDFFFFHLVRACLEFNSVVHGLCTASRCLPGRRSAMQSIQPPPPSPSFLSDLHVAAVFLAQHVCQCEDTLSVLVGWLVEAPRHPPVLAHIRGSWQAGGSSLPLLPPPHMSS